MGRVLAPRFGEVLERVFVPLFWGGYLSMGRILTPCFGEGIRPTDEYLPHDLEMVFVHGRILSSCCGEGIRQNPTNSLVYALRILWGRINDFIYTSTAAVDYRDSLLVR